MIGPMALWAAALWGLLGAGAVEAWELYGAIHRVKDFPWKKTGEIPLWPFLLSVAIRLVLGVGLATAFVASGQAGGPVGALAVGVASPKLLEQLARQALPRATAGVATEPVSPAHDPAEGGTRAP